ncbi:MAG: hypothetical protein K2F53_04905 [Rikenellaceae bacterium]|nr:hypothetical protein [Rikenellaceae bacterium]MDE7355797.1 hypothetical protein [Rikenellaceae bacterium]
MKSFSFARNFHHNKGNDVVTELLRRLVILWFSLAFYREKKYSVTNAFSVNSLRFSHFCMLAMVYFKTATIIPVFPFKNNLITNTAVARAANGPPLLNKKGSL